MDDKDKIIIGLVKDQLALMDENSKERDALMQKRQDSADARMETRLDKSDARMELQFQKMDTRINERFVKMEDTVAPLVVFKSQIEGGKRESASSKIDRRWRITTVLAAIVIIISLLSLHFK